MSAPYDRPTNDPGGMECMECGIIFIGAETHYRCAVCEAAYVAPHPEDVAAVMAANAPKLIAIAQYLARNIAKGSSK